eukprot:m.472930 g.472930  ORF g.472930 m.472930 type:complete len:194 (+) comp33517_c0_seq1:184-765(+)
MVGDAPLLGVRLVFFPHIRHVKKMKFLVLFLFTLSLGSCARIDHSPGAFQFCSGGGNLINKVDRLVIDIISGVWYASDTGGHFNIHEGDQYILINQPYPILLPSADLDSDELERNLIAENRTFLIQRQVDFPRDIVLITESLSEFTTLYSFEHGLTKFPFRENDLQETEIFWETCGGEAMTFEAVNKYLQQLR